MSCLRIGRRSPHFVALALAGHAQAQTAEEFYKGRQITFVVGYEVGNDYDIGARLLARHLSKELPGNPTIVVQNMPQASGVVAANYMALKAARDGTVIGGISRNLPSQAMMKLPNIEADPRKFIWLGATSFPGRVCVASSAAPVKTAADLFTTDLLTGAAGAGSSTDIVPTVISRVLGMRFKMVQGYRGAGDILLAVDRGEVHAVCMSLGQFRTSEQKFKDGKLRYLLRAEESPLPGVPDVPSVYDFAKTDEQRQLMRYRLLLDRVRPAIPVSARCAPRPRGFHAQGHRARGEEPGADRGSAEDEARHGLSAARASRRGGEKSLRDADGDDREGQADQPEFEVAIGGDHMNRVSALLVAMIALVGACVGASAQDKLKVALPQKGAWDAGLTELGYRGGIFKKHGLDVEILYTQAGPESIQALIGGSIDIATAAGVSAAVGTFAKGAPIRIIGSEIIGAPDLYWYVRADSPVRKIEDFNGKTVAYSLTGSSSHAGLLALIAQYKLTAKPTSTGSITATLTQTPDRTGRCRFLGHSVLSRQGGFRANPHHRNRQRRGFAAEPDRPRQSDQRGDPAKPQGRDRPLAQGLTRKPLTGCIPIRRR